LGITCYFWQPEVKGFLELLGFELEPSDSQFDEMAICLIISQPNPMGLSFIFCKTILGNLYLGKPCLGNPHSEKTHIGQYLQQLLLLHNITSKETCFFYHFLY